MAAILENGENAGSIPIFSMATCKISFRRVLRTKWYHSWRIWGCTRTPRAPPDPLMSGIILFRGPFWIIFYILPWKILGWTLHFRHFPKWPPFRAIFTYNSVSEAHIVVILLSIPMFSGSRNPLRTTKLTMGHFAVVDILKFKIAAKKITLAL